MPAGRRSLSRRPRLESLEPRRLPASFTVSTTADDGPGSLRAAIVAANADGSAGVDAIDFAIGPAGTMETIAPESALPTITRPVFLDGTSEPGYAGVPLVVITGTAALRGSAGLALSGGSSTVEGLEVVEFGLSAYLPSQPPGGQGILLTGRGGDRVIANYLGGDASGNRIGDGIGVEVDTPNDTIGGAGVLGNLISNGDSPSQPTEQSTEGDAILVLDAPGAVILGNKIGTDPRAGTGRSIRATASMSSIPPASSSAGPAPARGT